MLHYDDMTDSSKQVTVKPKLLGYQTKKKSEDVPLVEFTYLVFTRMPGESYHVVLVLHILSAN